MGSPLDTLFADEQQAADTTASSAQSGYSRIRLILLAVVLIGIVLAGLATWRMTGRILAAVFGVRDGLDRLARGDLTTTASSYRSRDEIAHMDQAMNRAVTSLRGWSPS